MFVSWGVDRWHAVNAFVADTVLYYILKHGTIIITLIYMA